MPRTPEAHGRIVSVLAPRCGEAQGASHPTPTCVLVNHRHVRLEGLLLHAQVQPQGRQRVLFHTRVFMPRAVCEPASPAAALRYFQRPQGEKPDIADDRAPLPGDHRRHAAGRRPPR